jgi:molybdopterin-guanine dinucleotide biosynthesis protein A
VAGPGSAAGVGGPAGTLAVTGAVLAGGLSTRMGTNKALLEVGGVRLIDGALATLRAIFPEVLVIANDAAPYAGLDLPILPDLLPGKGSLGGLYTAVSAAGHPHTFCLACDMPFANPALIRYLAGLAQGHDVVVPRTAEGVQPLHAVYGKGCLQAMRRQIEADRLKIDRLYPAVRVRYVDEDEMRPYDPELLSFWNLNTREDLALARRTRRP